MNEQLTRLILGILAATSVVTGAWAGVAPRSFYDDFPGFGGHWVSGDGPFNEHLVRDVGWFNLALAVAAVIAAVTLARAAVGAAAALFLVSGVPHLVYHLEHLGALSTNDQVGSIAGLALRAARRGRRPGSDVPGTSRRRRRRRREDARIGADVPLFAFEHVTVDGPYGVRVADADGEVPGGQVVVLVGPSGAGKSTLLRLCNRLDVPTAGRVVFRGDDVAGLDPMSLRRRVGMVFQRPTPFPGTVAENLRIAEPGLADAEAAAALLRVGLDEHFLDRPATELSGGEAQRVCLARTLVTAPEVVLMDEPTSSVDPAARHALESLARGLAADGVSVLWVTHDLDQMRRVGDHALVVVAGRIAHAAPARRARARRPGRGARRSSTRRGPCRERVSARYGSRAGMT